MSRSSIFVCQHCGASSPKWMGRCAECGAWNSLVEERTTGIASKGNSRGSSAYAVASSVQRLSELSLAESRRQSCGIGELDRVLGGGLVEGAAILLGGEPGIGKSTLLLQAAAGLAQGQPVLYVTGEESAAQVALRAQRLDLLQSPMEVLAENHLESIESVLAQKKPKILLVDSIQTLFTDT
nr:AAA family ATPase [Acidithiobacillus sp.]